MSIRTWHHTYHCCIIIYLFIYYLLSLIPDIRAPARRGCAPPPGLGFAFAPGVRGAMALPHELAPSTQRGGFLVQCAVFSTVWAAPFRCSIQATSLRKATWSSPSCVPPLMVWSVLEIGAPREARWRCLPTSDGASWLDCASHFDVTSFDVNILAPFGADSRISRTARRMAHDLLCAALLLLGCLRPARAARLAIAALGICRASYLDLLLDAA